MAEQLRQHRLYFLMFALNLVILAGVIYMLRRPEPRAVTIITPSAESTTAPIRVQVGGAIIQPGVYTLTLGSRVSDALEAAGGARPDADLDGLNLASKLSDGAAIAVPTRAGAVVSTIPAVTDSRGAPGDAPNHDKININSATAEELDTLPNIGPILAQRIVDYRTEKGDFGRIEDIKNVQGIGDSIFQDLLDLISVQ